MLESVYKINKESKTMADVKTFPSSELENMHIANGMIRLDFKAAENFDGKDLRAIMTPQGYIQVFGMMQKVLDKLEAEGKIQRVQKPQQQ